MHSTTLSGIVNHVPVTTFTLMSHTSAEIQAVAISQDEKEFFAQLGARIARLRKAADVTQVQLAEFLGVSQQTVNAYEMGHRRMAISALPRLAKLLGVSIEELIGEKVPAGKRGPTPLLQKQIERLTSLPKAQQKVVMQMLEGVLSQAGR
jgi:transcriptional regulator with XRE-family HTH domain